MPKPGWRVLAACALLWSILLPQHAVAGPNTDPLISQGVPAFAADNNSQADLANNSNYDDNWRSFRTPSSSQPTWLAYDLSSKAPKQVILTWYNTSNYGYENSLAGGSAYNLPQNYTIDVNAAPGGGSPPTSGWTTKVTVTGNDYHSRTAIFDMTGYNWVRINITSILGSYENEDASLNMDVFDARNGTQDTWLFLGDSITAGGMVQSGTTFSQTVDSIYSWYYPSQENGGLAGWTTTGFVGKISQFLSVSPAHFVTLSLGTNDLNTFAGDTNSINTAYNNLVSMANTILAAGRVPIIPHVPWARLATIQSNAPVLNAKIDALCASNPYIIRGPDLYGYFQANQGLIGSDNLHPSSPTGFQAYRTYWANWAAAVIYNNGWVPNGTYKVINRLSGLALDAYGLGTSNGTIIDQWAYNGGNNQRWNVIALGNGVYSVTNVNANLVLDSASAGGSGTFTQLWTNYGYSEQEWTFTPTSGGYYEISPLYNSGLALDDYGASTSNYNPSTNFGRIDVWNWNGGSNQQWAFLTP